MYKLTTKTGSLIFSNIEDLVIYVISAVNKLFNDDSFIKISKLEDMQ